MNENPCSEIALGKSVWSNFPYEHELPNLTYPTVTRWGIKEMTREQQRNYTRSTMKPDEVIRTLEQRVRYLEEVVEMLLRER